MAEDLGNLNPELGRFAVTYDLVDSVQEYPATFDHTAAVRAMPFGTGGGMGGMFKPDLRFPITFFDEEDNPKPLFGSTRMGSSIPTDYVGGSAGTAYYTMGVEYDGQIYVAGGGNLGNRFLRYDPTEDQWYQLPNVLSTCDAGAIAACAGKIIIAMGGNKSKKVQIYDIATEQWTYGANDSLHGLRYPAYAQQGEYLYVFGGWDGNPVTSSSRLNLTNYTWEELENYPQQQFGAAAVPLEDGNILVFGGRSLNSENMTATFLYSTTNNTFKYKSSLPYGLISPMACCRRGKIYSFGGKTNDPDYNFYDFVFSTSEKDNFEWTMHNSTLPYTLANSCAVVVDNEAILIGGSKTTDSSGTRDITRFNLSEYVTIPANKKIRYAPSRTVIPKYTMTNLPTPPVGTNIELAGVAEYEGKIYVCGGQGGSSGKITLWCFDIRTREWVRLANLLKSVYIVEAVAVNGKIYITGGKGSDSRADVQIYDIATDTWSYGAPMPAARHGVSNVVCDGVIYAMGGFVKSQNYAKQRQMWAYDIATDTWDTTLPDMPEVAYARSVRIGNKIYIPGFSGNGGGGGVSDKMMVYDINEKTWSYGPSLPKATYQQTVFAYNGKLGFIGGRRWDGSKTYPTGAGFLFDPETEEWSPLKTITPRKFASGVVVNDDLYIVGGHSSAQLDIYSLKEKYTLPDSTTKVFTVYEDSKYQVSEFGGLINAAIVPNGDTVYVFGGSKDDVCSANAYTFEVSTGNVTPLAPMPDARQAHSATLVGDDIFVIGGYKDDVTSGFSQVWRYNITEDAWHTGLTDVTFPDVRFHSVTASGNRLFVHGGYCADAGVALSAVRVYDIETDTWGSGAAHAFRRTHHAGVSFAGDLYVLGGESDGSRSNSFSKYNPRTDEWEDLPNLPVATTKMLAHVWNNKLYIIGGETSTGISDDIFEYDFIAKTWTKLHTSLSFPVTNEPVAFVNDLDVVMFDASGNDVTHKLERRYPIDFIPKVIQHAEDPITIPSRTRTQLVRLKGTNTAFFIGGVSTLGGSGDPEMTDTVHFYHEGSSMVVSLLPKPLADHTCVELDGNIYIVGGTDSNDNLQSEVYRFNPDTRQVTPLGSNGPQLKNAAVVAHQGQLYVVGGVTNDSVSADVYRVDLTSGADWTLVTQIPEARTGAGICVHAGKLHVVGGRDISNVLKASHYAYDLTADTWSTLADLPTAKEFMMVGAISDRVVMFGGRNNSVKTNTFYVYRHETDDYVEHTNNAVAPGSTDSGLCFVNNEIVNADHMMGDVMAVSSSRIASRVEIDGDTRENKFELFLGATPERTDWQMLVPNDAPGAYYGPYEVTLEAFKNEVTLGNLLGEVVVKNTSNVDLEVRKNGYYIVKKLTPGESYLLGVNIEDNDVISVRKPYGIPVKMTIDPVFLQLIDSWENSGSGKTLYVEDYFFDSDKTQNILIKNHGEGTVTLSENVGGQVTEFATIAAGGSYSYTRDHYNSIQDVVYVKSNYNDYPIEVIPVAYTWDNVFRVTELPVAGRMDLYGKAPQEASITNTGANRLDVIKSSNFDPNILDLEDQQADILQSGGVSIVAKDEGVILNAPDGETTVSIRSKSGKTTFKTITALTAMAVGTHEEWQQHNSVIPNGMPILSDRRLFVGDGVRTYSQLTPVVDNTITDQFKGLIANANQPGGVVVLDEQGLVRLQDLPPSLLGSVIYVDNITQRNMIDEPLGLVVVLDASDDPEVEAGPALYGWDDFEGVWVKLAEPQELDQDLSVLFKKSESTLDDVDDGTSYVKMVLQERAKLLGIEDYANVTNAEVVEAAGAVMRTHNLAFNMTAEQITEHCQRLNPEAEIVYRFSNNPVDKTYDGSIIEDHPELETTEDGPALVLSYNNLTLDDFTLTPTQRCKGMFIEVRGDLTLRNNSSIQMTARGANAPGDEIGLDYAYRYVAINPTRFDSFSHRISAYGGSGGSSVFATGSGNIGDSGILGACGGGGSGSCYEANGGSGRGGGGNAGTSYSGGSGGGGCYAYGKQRFAGHGVADGGAGGDGTTNSSASNGSGAGAGNPAGNDAGTVSVIAESGTGGLLVLFVHGNIYIDETSGIYANGSTGGSGTGLGGSGGGSGGGAIHIFHHGTFDNTDRVEALGGAGGSTVHRHGGSGGNGTVNIVQMQ